MSIFKQPKKVKRNKPHHGRPYIKFPLDHKVQKPTEAETKAERNARRKKRREAWARLVVIYKTGRVRGELKRQRKRKPRA